MPFVSALSATAAPCLIIGASALTGECGPGHVAARLADTGARVAGVDLAPVMVEAARAAFPDLEFREANAEHLPFDERSPEHGLLGVLGVGDNG